MRKIRNSEWCAKQWEDFERGFSVDSLHKDRSCCLVRDHVLGP